MVGLLRLKISNKPKAALPKPEVNVVVAGMRLGDKVACASAQRSRRAKI